MMTQQCLSRGQLQNYLSGWANDADAVRIEEHLALCAACEETVVALEAEPDTLLQAVRPDAGSASEDGVASRINGPIDQAIRAAKLHVPSGSTTPPEETPGSPWPMLGHEIAGYELLRPLGRGGMGTVYVAKHRKLGKEVAIKLLPSAVFRDPQFAARFQREMRAAGGLEHVAIVRATDAGEVAGVHYLVMELVDGLDLSRLVRNAGKLEIADACEIARQIASGLAHAHASGVVHRDIKPSNIVVSRDGSAKLLDFGLAQTELWDEASVELTTVGQLMGTLDYMAPEQAERPEAVDYRADLYSLGATIFRLLAGRTPLSIAPSLSPLAKLRLLAMHQPPSIDTIRDDVPSGLVKLVSELLARSPEQRPPSADHVAERLCEFSGDADLSRLVEVASEQADSEADFEVPESVCLPAIAKVRDSERLAQPERVLEPSFQNSGGEIRSSTWAWLTTAALVLALATAGIVFALETQKGQLVVESDVPGITVEVRQAGKVAKELTIKGAAETTRLWAGKYEVVLGAGSDSVRVVGGSVSVMRGETKVARVQLIADDARQSEAVANEIAPLANSSLATPRDEFADEPMYDNKTLGQWLELMRRERSPAALEEVFIALKALCDEATGQRISTAVLQSLPGRRGSMQAELNSAARRGRKSLDEQSFAILSLANRGKAYFDLLLHELESDGDIQWKTRVISKGFQFGGRKVEEITDLYRWVLDDVLETGDAPELRAAAIEVFRENAQLSYTERPVAELLIDALRIVHEDTPEYWLEEYPEGGAYGWNVLWAQEVAKEAQRVLKSTLEQSNEYDRSSIIRAERILYFLCALNRDQDFFLKREEIRCFVHERANKWDLEELLSTTPIDSGFRNAYRLFRGGELGAIELNLRSISAEADVEVFALMKLAEAAFEPDAYQSFLNQILQRTESTTFDLLFSAIPNTYRTSNSVKVKVELDFPELKGSSRVGLQSVTREQWIEFLISSEIYSQFEREQQYKFQSRLEYEQRERWYASQLGIEHDATETTSVAFDRVKEVMREQLVEADVAVDSGLDWQKLCVSVDRDGDERINAIEFIDLQPIVRRSIDSSLEWAWRQIGKYDRDRDGELSRTESEHMPIKPVGADYNRNGAITEGELARHRSET